MSEPLISVLTPSFNQAEWLKDCLRSVSDQSHKNIEHIVMDGGSTDGTTDILRDYPSDNVRWESAPDKGQGDAINKAFSVANGEIIAWLNSDDCFFDSRAVSRAVKCFEAHPEVDVVYGHALQINAEGAFGQILWTQPFDGKQLRMYDFISQPTIFMRREALPSPLLDITFHYALDYELWLRLAKAGLTFKRLNHVLAVDRVQPLRKSTNLMDVLEADTARLATEYDLLRDDAYGPDRLKFYRKQRIMGGLMAPWLSTKVVFDTPPHPKRGLLGRQLFSRKSNWESDFL